MNPKNLIYLLLVFVWIIPAVASADQEESLNSYFYTFGDSVLPRPIKPSLGVSFQNSSSSEAISSFEFNNSDNSALKILPRSIDSGGDPYSLQEFWLSKSYQAGVENRILTEYLARFDINDSFSYQLGLSLSFLQQWGLSLVGFAGIWKIPFLFSELTLAFQQERWPTWKFSENRVELYWSFSPTRFATLSLGYSYRSPQLNANFLKSLEWPGQFGEYGLVYRFESDLFQFDRGKLSLLVFDYDRMKLDTYTNIHLSLQPQYQFTRDLKLQGLIGIAAVGVSGGVVSWDESFIKLGIAYGIP